MNDAFIKKIIQAKKLEYEAIKEILPEKMKDRIDTFEKETFRLIKDIAIELIKDGIDERKDTRDQSDPSYKGESICKHKATYKRTKKISIDFN